MATVDDLQALPSYVYSCRHLAKDIEDILSDIEYRINGGRIRYALDFSEVHSYVDPVPDEIAQLKVFSDDNIASCWATQNAVVTLLLFGLDRKAVLLPPYVAELQGYLNWSEDHPPKVLTEHLQRVADEADKLRESAMRDELLRIIDALQREPDQVSKEDKDSLFQYVETNASNLVVVVQDGQANPRYVLNELLRRRPFIDLQSFLIAEGSDLASLRTHKETAKRWEDELERRRTRRRGANYRDAYVMMLLEAINAKLAETQTRLCLVTRSSYMHEYLDQELAEKRWKGPQERILRHPRSFIASAAESSDDDLHAVRKRLQAQLTSIQAFLYMMESREDMLPDAIASDRLLQHELTREDKEKAADLIAAIKREWRQLVSLAAAEAGARGVGPGTGSISGRSRLDVVLEVLRAVRDPGALQTHVRLRIRELVRSINFHHQYVTALQGQALSSDDIVDDVRAAVGADSMRIDANYVPYTMVFHSPRVVAWSRQLSQDREVDPNQVLELFEQGFASGHTYEPLLALAYLFAAWDRWTLARDYAGLALAARVEDDPQPIEGFLFKATCLRMIHESLATDSVSSYYESMTLLDETIVLTHERDPRVLVEKAAQVFHWSLLLPVDRRKVKEAYMLSDQVLQLLEDRDDEEAYILKIRTYNNRCYYLLQLNDSASHRRAAEDHRRLLDALRSWNDDQTTWSPQIVDTVLWATWQLDGRSLAGEGRARLREQLIGQYEDLLRRNLRQLTRSIAGDHLDVLRRTTVSPA